MELFDSLTVAQNVAVGREAHFAGSNPIRHLVARPSERAAVAAAVDAAVELCGLGAIANRRAGAISTGQRRLVDGADLVTSGHLVSLRHVAHAYSVPSPHSCGLLCFSPGA